MASNEPRTQRRATGGPARSLRIRRKPCLIIDRETGEFFGRLAADVDSRGRPSAHRINDLWLAALAIQHGMKLVTQNERDFADLPGVDLVALPSR